MEWDPRERSAAANYYFLTSTVAPRPIAWVTTVDAAGPDGVVNVAPFSWYHAICAGPPTLMLSLSDRPGGGDKDTLRNLREQGECVVHVATADHAHEIVASSGTFPADRSEADALGLQTTPATLVAPPRLLHSPVAMECRLLDTRRLGDEAPVTLVLLEVVHVWADDEVLDDRGNVDPAKVPFLARLGRSDYTAVTDVFELRRPKSIDDLADRDG